MQSHGDLLLVSGKLIRKDGAQLSEARREKSIFLNDPLISDALAVERLLFGARINPNDFHQSVGARPRQRV
jgi:hypothetical protein